MRTCFVPTTLIWYTAGRSVLRTLASFLLRVIGPFLFSRVSLKVRYTMGPPVACLVVTVLLSVWAPTGAPSLTESSYGFLTAVHHWYPRPRRDSVNPALLSGAETHWACLPHMLPGLLSCFYENFTTAPLRGTYPQQPRPVYGSTGSTVQPAQGLLGCSTLNLSHPDPPGFVPSNLTNYPMGPVSSAELMVPARYDAGLNDSPTAHSRTS